MPQLHFQKYFTLDEAAELIPYARETFAQAHEMLKPLRDEVILYKRLQMTKEEEAISPEDVDLLMINQILEQKIKAFEDQFRFWVQQFTDKGIQVKHFEKGLIDFPYVDKDGNEYLLCWTPEDEGLFYFHDLEEGYAGRKPITFLPE